MGLFNKKGECSICHSNIATKKLSDGEICKECISKCNLFIKPLSWKQVASQKVRDAISQQKINSELLKQFSSTKTFGTHLTIDETNHLWKLDHSNIIFRYNEIISYELLEDGETITKGGLGSAIVGGVLFGGAGAIVGGTVGKKRTKQEITEYKIKIVTKNAFYPNLYIDFLITGKIKSGSFSYKLYHDNAQSILSALSVMVNTVSEQNTDSVSPADEILKYKQLLDNGIISEEDFENKKNQLLKM